MSAAVVRSSDRQAWFGSDEAVELVLGRIAREDSATGRFALPIVVERHDAGLLNMVTRGLGWEPFRPGQHELDAEHAAVLFERMSDHTMRPGAPSVDRTWWWCHNLATGVGVELI